MIKFVSKKQSWTNDDLIAYFGLDLKNFDLMQEGSLFLTKMVDSDISYLSEDFNEWKELASRLVFESNTMCKNFKTIANTIAAKQYVKNINAIKEILQENESYLQFSGEKVTPQPKAKSQSNVQQDNFDKPEKQTTKTTPSGNATQQELDKLNGAL